MKNRKKAAAATIAITGLVLAMVIIGLTESAGPPSASSNQKSPGPTYVTTTTVHDPQTMVNNPVHSVTVMRILTTTAVGSNSNSTTVMTTTIENNATTTITYDNTSTVTTTKTMYSSSTATITVTTTATSSCSSGDDGGNGCD